MKELGQVINQAEAFRAAGNFPAAIGLAKAHAEYNQDLIPQIPPDEINDVMRLWRIWEVGLLGASQATFNGKEAQEFLNQAAAVVGNYYHHPTIISAAESMKQDANGHEYQMAAEMKRDEGKLHLYLYRLTLNPKELDLAIAAFDQAIIAANVESSAYALAVMEREIVKRHRGEGLNFKKFKSAYKAGALLAAESGNWDRLAASSWWFVREALISQHPREARVGMKNLIKAAKSGKVNWLRYPAKELTQPAADKLRRAIL